MGSHFKARLCSPDSRLLGMFVKFPTRPRLRNSWIAPWRRAWPGADTGLFTTAVKQRLATVRT